MSPNKTPEPDCSEIERQVRKQVAEDLRRAAQGRRHYAEGWPGDAAGRAELEAESRVLESAARVAEGDRHTMRALLPVAMWTDAEYPIRNGSEQ